MEPFKLFSDWMDEASREESGDTTVMALATATPGGKPSLRMVLLKEYSEKGFVFFTNFSSRKGEEILENPAVALSIYWERLERQVRIEGKAVRAPDSLSEKYFASRPVGSQVSAIISPQSKVISGRGYLEELKKVYLESNVGENKRPDNWGGFVVVPDMLEFWQGMPNRLHQRVLYRRSHKGWKKEILAP